MAACLTGLSLVAHVASPSSFHQPEENWKARIIAHQTHPAFKVRPITTGIVTELHRIFGWSYRDAFFALQFLLMLLCGPAFYHYLWRFDFAHGYAVGGMIIFYLSLPVFMAHFDPVYTWDDFWVYLMIPLSFICVLRRFTIMAILTLVWAMLARETSIMFLPAWFILIRQIEHGRLARPVFYTLLALLVVAVFRGTMAAPAPAAEFKLSYNFAYSLRTGDTIFSLLAALGFLWPVGIYQIRSGAGPSSNYLGLFRWGAVITAAGFVLSTILFAQARETRLFFPPFVFFIPLALLFIRDHADAAGRLWRRTKTGLTIAAITCLLAVSVAVTILVFPAFDFRTWQDGNRLFFSLHLTAAGLAGIVHLYRKRLSS